jgi:DNA polymerase (family X)
MPLDALNVAKLLAEYGRRTALAGGNPYRSKARIVNEDRLQQIPGVGDAIADIVMKLHRAGTHPSLERMRQEIPNGVLEMLTIPGLRPNKVLKLYRDFGIASLPELEVAAREDRIKSAKGLGAALQRKILQGLEIRKTANGARHIHRAAQLLAAAETNLRKSLPLERIIPGGDFRRGCELVFDLAVVAETEQLEGAPKVVKSGELSVYLTDRQRLGASLLLATGSEAHLQELREVAKSKRLDLTEDGVRKDGTIIASETEAVIYEALGLQYIEPELREGRNEIALARLRRIPALVSTADLRGILHAHTDASDGVNRHRCRTGPGCVCQTWRVRGGECQPLETRPRLALARARASAGVHVQHQSGCPLDLGD